MNLKENIPPFFIEKRELISRYDAIKNIHFPQSYECIQEARSRLIYEEFFFTQFCLMKKKKQVAEIKVQRPTLSYEDLYKQFQEKLTFSLTNDQKKVFKDIEMDMDTPKPMMRLIQGDVGSGKTVVAFYALLLNFYQKKQGVMMAPTEILAEQHFQAFSDFAQHWGLRVAFLCSSLNTRKKREIIDNIQLGLIDVVIGTHAVFQEALQFSSLGLAIVDEQHKFGVGQRICLKNKGDAVDMLIMTATPIPRTLAMTFYGDLDVSIIREKPQGRKQIETYWISDKSRSSLIEFIKRKIEKREQVYWVCPFVEESENMQNIKAVNAYDKEIKKQFKSVCQVISLHGKMSPQEKEEKMWTFRAGDAQIMVASSIVEVGIDVKKATIIVIEDAQRFGLSQLHQLRGRVGRNQDQSYCFIVSNSSDSKTRERMAIFRDHADGFVLAEEDLRIRGPGEMMGEKQHGLLGLELASLTEDEEILNQVREDIQLWMAEGEGQQDCVWNNIRRKYQHMMDTIGVG